MRRLPLRLATVAALSGAVSPIVHAAEPEPIEQELFDSWVGRYKDMTPAELLKHLAVPPQNKSPLPFPAKSAKYYGDVVKALKLSPEAKALLDANGLALVRPQHNYSMAAAYYELYTKDLPLLVTTDSILDAMHRSFDAILAELETQVLRKTLQDALRKVHYALPELAKTHPALIEAATDLDLYLTVALNLLEADPNHGRLMTAPRFGDGKEVLELLTKVDKLVLENPGMGVPGTRLYGHDRAIDWSQFKPRGHYAKTPELSRYFRAVMWLGRADTGWLLEQPRQLRAAALFTQLLQSTQAQKGLDAMKSVIDLMVGRSDELTPQQFATVLAKHNVTLNDLSAEATLTRIADALAANGLGQQRIRSQLVVSDPNSPVKVPPPPIFQPFGQRFVLDSFVLSKVVYDDILYEGRKQLRMMPTGLDVMAALGNSLAVGLLAETELPKWNYSANLAALRDVVGAWTDATWSDNLYSLWLDALRTLSVVPQGKVPAVMQRHGWSAKMLQTQLASWAQLRHDTILYAKQSYTASLGCLYPEGFVEPYPDFYAKLARFASEAARRFDALASPELGGNLITSYSNYFRTFAKHMTTLEGIANKELAGKELSGKEEDFLDDTIERKMTGGGYAPEPDWSGWYIDLVYAPGGDDDAVKFEPVIADVHTDPDSATVLEVGTGNVDFAVMVVDVDGDKAVHVGPTFSYYEFVHPAADRLTDEQWTQLVAADKAPGRPSWIAPLLTR